MNITFLVGNGFDIACGIDTSYKAFYNWYLKQPSSSKVIDYLKKDIKSNWENWSDFEMGLAKFTKYFLLEDIEDFDINDFFDCYKDAQNNIIKFLKLQINNIDFNLIEDNQIFEFINNIVYFFRELPSAEGRKIGKILTGYGKIQYNFISFNYTQTLNKLVKLAEKKCNKQNYTNLFPIFNFDVINIHGTLTKSPLLGVSDENLISNKELLKNPFFDQVMIKPQSANAMGESWYNDAIELIEKSKIICIFGMSLGDSDSYLWEKIANHLNKTPDCHLIIFWYTKNPPSSISTYDTLFAKDIIKDKIANYSCLSKDEIKKMKERIYVVFNTDKVLNITLPQANNKTLLPI